MLNNYETGVDGSIVEICRPNEVVSVVIVVESEDASSKDGSVLLSSVVSFNSCDSKRGYRGCCFTIACWL